MSNFKFSQPETQTFRVCEANDVTGVNCGLHIRQAPEGSDLCRGRIAIALCGKTVSWDRRRRMPKRLPRDLCPTCESIYKQDWSRE